MLNTVLRFVDYIEIEKYVRITYLLSPTFSVISLTQKYRIKLKKTRPDHFFFYYTSRFFFYDNGMNSNKSIIVNKSLKRL